MLKHVDEIAFGPHGGAELFFADIDGDGQVEILAYQGPGVFGAGMYRHWPHVAAAFPESTCVSAFKKDGSRLWTYGQPNPTDHPYICHAHECCVACGDVDGDGIPEVVLADGDRVVLLDGPTGEERAQTAMPEDNFYIVQVLGEPTGQGEAALVVKNGEGGYGDWRYGEPLIGLDTCLNMAWEPMAIPGAGHHILSVDLDADGRREFLVGYCSVKPSGEWRCIVDAVKPEEADPDHDHVDFQDIFWADPKGFYIGFAGSSNGYLVDGAGSTLFVKPDRHVQGCAVGRFRDDSPFQLAIYNDDGPMVLYDTNGMELWRITTEERWPLGMPQACAGHPFHRNRPVVKWPGNPDRLIFTDGGWPWVMDGEGGVTTPFQPPPNSRQPDMRIPDRARADDMGYGFATKLVDWDGGGIDEICIYDRRFLWRFPAASG